MLVLAIATVFTLSVTLWSQLVGVVLPLIVGFVTKQSTASWIKAVLLAFLAAVAGVANAAIAHDGTVVVREALQLGVAAWIAGIASYYGFHKPTGLAEKAQTSGVTD